MTRNRIKELMPVLQAWADGKQIQVRRSDSEPWGTFYGDCPDFSLTSWRVKPTPREWWIVAGSACETQQIAEEMVRNFGLQGSKIIHVREVE